MTETTGLDFAPTADTIAAELFNPWPTVTLPDGTVFTLGCRLPSGAEVTFRDPLLLRAKDQEQIIRTMGESSSVLSASLDIANGTAALLIEGWTLDLPSPRDVPTSLGDLLITDKRALLDHISPVIRMLFPDTTPSSDRTSPTGPSSG